MQENSKRIKLQKASAIALLCLFFAVFVGSIFCATILPFADENGVASADSIIPKQLPTLGDLDSGASVYGLVVDTANFGYFVNSNFSSVKNMYIGIEFLCDGEGSTSFLYLYGVDVANSDYSLYFDYFDNGGASVVGDVAFPKGCTLFCSDGGEDSGIGYILFDKAFVYTEPTDSNALTLCEGVFAITSPLNELWSSSSFTNRFVTPYNYACQDVYFDLSATPTIPSAGFYGGRSGQVVQFYVFDYFKYGLKFMNSSPTVRWTLSHRPSSTSWTAVLSIG